MTLREQVVYEEWGEWFFAAFKTKFGSFPNEDEAWDKYREIYNNACPTCEGE